jgi:uncharacterized protein (DUF4415 family)
MTKKKAKIKYGNVELESGTFEPRNVKERVNTFIDEDVVDWLRNEAAKIGVGYQTLLNIKLREAMQKPSLEKRIEALERKFDKHG